MLYLRINTCILCIEIAISQFKPNQTKLFIHSQQISSVQLFFQTHFFTIKSTEKMFDSKKRKKKILFNC
jgi:hypothetical protein